MGGLLGVPPAGALVNFLVGSLALAAVSFSGLFGPVQVSAAGEAPWWAWIGVPEVPLSASRVLGAVLLFAGVLLIQRG